MMERLVVGAIVVAAAVYAIWALLPLEARQRLARRLVEMSGRRRWPAWLRSGAAALDQRAGTSGDPCANCSAHQARDDAKH